MGAKAQEEKLIQGEFGITAGVAHYFGDLNTRAQINKPKIALGAFFRKQFGNYIGVRVSTHYAQVGYSDTYSKNEYQRTRNLSFNSNIWELAVQGDFNFFKFVPNDPNYQFTPYVTLGVGVFSYDPYAYLNGEKVFLRPLGTEGQTQNFDSRKEYSPMAVCIPFGVGIKYNLNEKVNISFEISNRFTTTDYLDDVSTTYIDPSLFPKYLKGDDLANALVLNNRAGQDPDHPDRKYVLPGDKRGNSSRNDHFFSLNFKLGYVFAYKLSTRR